MSSYQALDTLMSGYLGPAGFYVTGTEDVAESLAYYLEHEPAHVRHELLEDIEAFKDEYAETDDAFERHYRHSSYEGSPLEFLSVVETRTRNSLGLEPLITTVPEPLNFAAGKTYKVQIANTGLMGGFKRFIGLGYAEIGRTVVAEARASVGEVIEVAIAKGSNEVTVHASRRRKLIRGNRAKSSDRIVHRKTEKHRS